MVILDQYQGLFGILHLLQSGRSEFLVDGFIIPPILRPEGWTCMRNVAERPEPLIGKSIVITFFFFFGEPDPFEDVLRLLWGNSDFTLVIHHLAVGITASMSNPGSSAGLEDRLQGRHQPTGGPQAFHLFPSSFMHVRFAVGYHEEKPFLEEGTYLLFKPRWRPGGFGSRSETCFLLGRCSGC